MTIRKDWVRVDPYGVESKTGRYQATRRGAAMLREARRLYTAKTGKAAPYITQGGKSGAVTASGGTHTREAFDTSVRSLSAEDQRLWRDCMRKVGFADWHRTYLRGVWPTHNHAVPKGGDLSSGAAAQTRNFAAGRDGLRSNRIDKTITAAHKAATWEKYQAAQKATKTVVIAGKTYPDITSVSAYWVARNWDAHTVSVNVYYVQQWLAKVGIPTLADGLAGPKTRAALDLFRGGAVVVPPGTPPTLGVLQLLAAEAKQPKKPTRAGK